MQTDNQRRQAFSRFIVFEFLLMLDLYFTNIVSCKTNFLNRLASKYLTYIIGCVFYRRLIQLQLTCSIEAKAKDSQVILDNVTTSSITSKSNNKSNKCTSMVIAHQNQHWDAANGIFCIILCTFKREVK